MFIAAAVIVFHPDKKTLENILSYSSQVGHLYIFDNTEISAGVTGLFSKAIPHCNVFHDGENKGIAKRLNQACELAINAGFDLLLTMDQDSYFENDDIKRYIDCLENNLDKEKIVMTGVETVTSANHYFKDCSCISETSVITSGSIINLPLYKKVGLFDERLFIDQVDMEFCYRAVRKGFEVIKFPNICLNHSLGTTSLHRSLKSLQNTPRSLHSPVRIYYMTRNFLYIKAMYKEDFLGDVIKARKDLLIRIKNNLLYKGERIATIRMIVKGIVDYKKGRMGKINR